MKLRSTLLGLGALGLGFASADAAIVRVSSNITANTTWSAANEYILEGRIYVKNNATLTIAAGTVVRGQPRDNAADFSNQGAIIVTRQGRVNIQGTSSNPVIFTTAAVDDGDTANDTPADYSVTNGGSGSTAYYNVVARRATFSGTDSNATLTNGPFWDANPKTAPRKSRIAGLWGGVAILGNAPTNYKSNATTLGANAPITPVTQFSMEGLDATIADNYAGGVIQDDSSGIFSYVSIRHGGSSLSEGNEINGLTLAAVGSGTKVDHVEVWGNLDDGVEIFGGTVNVSYLSIINVQDDGFDTDLGWTGYAQFILVVGGRLTDAGFEIDGDDAGTTIPAGVGGGAGEIGAWTSGGAIYNATIIGIGATGIDNSHLAPSGRGMRIRSNASTSVYNSIIANLVSGAQSVRSNETMNYYNFVNGITYPSANALALGTNTNSANFRGTVTNRNSTANPGFYAFSFDTDGNPATINPLPLRTGQSGSPAATANISPLPSANTPLATVTYRGAFSTSAAPWTDGWTAGYLDASVGNFTP